MKRPKPIWVPFADKALTDPRFELLQFVQPLAHQSHWFWVKYVPEPAAK